VQACRADLQGCSPWIRSPSWDFGFLIGSVAFVAVPLLVYYGLAKIARIAPEAFQERDALNLAMFINLAVGGFIGGPHMYATFSYTLAEPSFRRRFWPLVGVGAFIPALVVVVAVVRIELLMTVFFTWASIHVLHQLSYILRHYHDRSPEGAPSAASRGLDYLLTLSALYPIGLWRLLAPPEAAPMRLLGFDVKPGFPIGDVDLSRQIPGFVHGQLWIAYAVWAVFAAAVVAFLVRTGWELFTVRRVPPRTLLVAVTIPVAFVIPAFDNLDVAFQGFNLWHSFQYLGLVFLVNSYRKERGEISSRFIASISGFGNARRYYSVGLALALGTALLIVVLHLGLDLPLLKVYYSCVLSVLLVHYLLDHVVFLTQRDSLTPPRGATELHADAGLGTSRR
jgi:hypothetical protein